MYEIICTFTILTNIFLSFASSPRFCTKSLFYTYGKGSFLKIYKEYFYATPMHYSLFFNEIPSGNYFFFYMDIFFRRLNHDIAGNSYLRGIFVPIIMTAIGIGCFIVTSIDFHDYSMLVPKKRRSNFPVNLQIWNILGR